MKILFINLFKAYTKNYVLREMKRAGAEVIEKTYYTPEDVVNDEKLRGYIYSDIKKYDPAFLFSINYWPVISRAAKDGNRKYISWSYDSPLNLKTTETMDFDNNVIFIFDREEAHLYKKKGINTVLHLPLASVTDEIKGKDIYNPSFSHDITFLGNFYDNFLTKLTEIMTPYDRGVINGFVAAQQRVYGAYILDDLIDDELCDRINKSYKALSEKAVQITPAELSFAAAKYITWLDRLTLKKALNAYCPGNIDYEKEMRLLFNESRINLNPVLRIIRSGIPLRALDIMGSNGFLLSSFQTELPEYFIDGEDIAMYGSLEEAVLKADFYLKNDDLRKKISLSGYEKIKKYFSYEERIKTILSASD